MSNAVFPALITRGWSVIKTPEWSTIQQRSTSGRETRIATMQFPLWNFTLTYEVLRSNTYKELQQLMDFYNARQGAFDNFLIDESFTPDDAATTQVFGIGDGVTTQFQLSRQIYSGGFAEPVMNLNGAPQIFDNAVLKATPGDYSINATGLVTFTYSPTAGHPLTWTGSYYFRARFKQDTNDFEEFVYQMFELKKLDLVADLGVRI